MAQFVRRSTAPSTTDKHWIRPEHGGVNECIEIVGSTGATIPNCVGYAWGRAYEIMGQKTALSKGNAGTWIDYTQDGYKRSASPSPGAIMCWSKDGGYGHVMAVEAINADGSVIASGSNYKGTRWYQMAFSPPSYNPWGSKYHFQGFIVPDYNFTPMEYIGTPADRDSTRYQMEVIVMGLRVRKRPEINDEVILGFANPGYYNVLSTRDMTGEASNGYYWYEIEQDKWVARKDEIWTNDYPAVVVDVDELKRQIAALSEKVAAIEQENETLKKEKAELQSKISAAVQILK